MIKYQTDKAGGSFTGSFFSWILQLGKNVQGVTAHAVTDYTWLPPVNSSAP